MTDRIRTDHNGRKYITNEPFKPDWDTQAVLVEEMQQRMAKQIEDLQQAPVEQPSPSAGVALPLHPEPHTYTWSALELEVVAAYGRDCFEAGRAQPGRALQSHTINASKTVAVATDVYWQPIETAPRGVKVQLLGKGGVATYGTYYGDPFWTHWCPLPRMPERPMEKS